MNIFIFQTGRVQKDKVFLYGGLVGNIGIVKEVQTSSQSQNRREGIRKCIGRG